MALTELGFNSSGEVINKNTGEVVSGVSRAAAAAGPGSAIKVDPGIAAAMAAAPTWFDKLKNNAKLILLGVLAFAIIWKRL